MNRAGLPTKRSGSWETEMAATRARAPSSTSGEPHRALSTMSNVSSRTTYARRPSRDPPQRNALNTGVSSPSIAEGPTQPCEVCNRTHLKTFFCVNCDCSFCDECWQSERPHRTGKVGPDGLPHEKADPVIVSRLKETFTPPDNPVLQEKMHFEDEDTTWFGIERDESGVPVFQEHSRFADLMLNSASSECVRYPQLVSFIGQTGAGKSTLIKMLIEQQRVHNDATTASLFPTPIPGSARNDNITTSGDVHLYADPATYMGALPLLYADCEGLEGGEQTPIANRHRETSDKTNVRKRVDSPIYDGRKGVKRRFKAIRESRRDIAWATSPEKQKRQYAVTELYPRLLYTFSDVIVFVLQNPKTFESTVLKMLLKWASSSMEKSLNQPTLPHAVIALNHTDMGVDTKEWNSDFATEKLLETVSGALTRDVKYKEYADYWTSQGKTVRTMKDLLECYYSSVRVVRIPKKGRYMLIDEQVKKLHDEITMSCNQSHYAKRKARMLSNADELQMYLQSAFDHFAQNLDKPFNFIDVAFRNNPIPLDFGGNILKLAIAVKKAGHCEGSREIFRQLSGMVASCIALDCARHGHLGSIDELLERYYLDYCDWALQDFCGRCEPCQFTNRKGQECVNVQEGHTKGHQNAKGTIIGTGPYKSSFNWNTYEDEWLILLQGKAKALQTSITNELIKDSKLKESKITSNIHREKMAAFYRRVGGAENIISHSICLCCLRDMPEHPLPCGHVLCWSCIADYGEFQPGAKVALTSCPLHFNDGFLSPWQITYKPSMAGVRILCLDGGGIRGIVELTVLREIEKHLGGQIPIQHFFDLIVGTSTGGILALGLGVERWTVQDCTNKFTRLVDKAFTPRLLSGFETVGIRYKTKPMEEALREVFHKENLFGGRHVNAGSYHIKVAVTAATKGGDQAVVLSNYNREHDAQATYGFIRPDNPNHELQTWEAARATSAAPTYFKPFTNKRTGEGFCDGALYYNNPAKVAYTESKLIWRDVEDSHPDILLSIGTGHNGKETPGIAETGKRLHRTMLRQLDDELPLESQRRQGFGAWLKKSSVAQFFEVLVNRVDNVLNAEQLWKDFRSWVDDAQGREGHRYIRVNPFLGIRPPRMDEKTQVDNLARIVTDRLRRDPGNHVRIRRIAHRLVASSFYFEKKELLEQADKSYICRGRIRCRLENSTAELRELGKFLSGHQTRQFQPFFRIYERDQEHMAVEKAITSNMIHDMVHFAKFSMGSHLDILCSDKLKATVVALGLSEEDGKFDIFPISGFPRCLTIDHIPKDPTTFDRQHMSLRRRSAKRRRSTLPNGNTRSTSSEDGIGLDQPVPDDITRHAVGPTDTYPERADDVNDWILRKTLGSGLVRPKAPPPYEHHASSSSESSIRTEYPQPVAGEEVFELAGLPLGASAMPMPDDEEAALDMAIDISLAEQAEKERIERRLSIGGTDLDQLDRAFAASRLEAVS